jgi:hypothetical protein
VWRERASYAERIGRKLSSSGLAALRSIVDHWPAAWAQRRFMGERLGVWVLAVTWLALPVGLVVFLNYCNQ